jgi:hypothetical protein
LCASLQVLATVSPRYGPAPAKKVYRSDCT